MDRLKNWWKKLAAWKQVAIIVLAVTVCTVGALFVFVQISTPRIKPPNTERMERELADLKKSVRMQDSINKELVQIIDRHAAKWVAKDAAYEKDKAKFAAATWQMGLATQESRRRYDSLIVATRKAAAVSKTDTQLRRTLGF